MYDNSDLIQHLVEIGLTNGESKAYLALLSIGTSTVTPIIDKSGISASKVYDIMNRLISKGLVSTISDEGTKLFTVCQPEEIMNILEEQEKKIEKNKEILNNIMPILKAKKDSVSKHPPVEFTRGVRGGMQIHYQAVEEAKENDLYFSNVGSTISKKLNKYWFEYSKMVAKKNMPQFMTYENRTWFDRDPKEHRRKERKKYYPTVLDKKYLELPNITIVGDSTIMMGKENGEPLTLVIRNKVLTQNMIKLLKIVRDSASVPEGFEKKELPI